MSLIRLYFFPVGPTPRTGYMAKLSTHRVLQVEYFLNRLYFSSNRVHIVRRSNCLVRRQSYAPNNTRSVGSSISWVNIKLPAAVLDVNRQLRASPNDCIGVLLIGILLIPANCTNHQYALVSPSACEPSYRTWDQYGNSLLAAETIREMHTPYQQGPTGLTLWFVAH